MREHMVIGHALLHRKKLETALNAPAQKRFMDESTDIVLGAVGSGDAIEAGVTAYMEEKRAQLDNLGSLFDGFKGVDGPFAGLFSLLEGVESTGASAAFNAVGATLRISGPRELRDKANQFFESFFDRLPNLTHDTLRTFIREEFDSLTRIFEQPYRQGARTTQAHKGFRTAATLRNVWGPALEKIAPDTGVPDFKAFLRETIGDVLNRLTDADLTALLGQVRAAVDLITPLAKASASLSGGVSFSFSGLSGMSSSAYSYLDDAKAVPETDKKSATWIADLITNVLSLFMVIWEAVRTRNYSDRPADGFFSVWLILHQCARCIMRSFLPDKINKDSFDEDGNDPNPTGKKLLNWIFTDEGDLFVNLSLRFLGSIHEMTQGAPSNWALSFAMRMLKYYSNTVNLRAHYWWIRSYKFFKDWKDNGFDTSEDRVPVPFGRAAWMMWYPMWFFSMIMGLIPAWEDFSLEKGMETERTIGPLITAIVVSFALGYVFFGVFSGDWPHNIPLKADWVTQVVLGLLWLFAMLGGSFIVTDLESKMQTLAEVVFGLIAGLLGIALLIMMFSLIFWNQTAQDFGIHLFLLLGGLFAGIILPFFLWWFYIDDGRDKLEVFKGLDASQSPYKLPYPSGENWLCGQGTHGIFSHIFSSPTDTDDSHYAYDFNEGEDSAAFAARECIVLSTTDSNPNEKGVQNDIEVFNPVWVEGQDPGANDERVLTHSKYIHLSQGRSWVDVGHRLSRGYHLLDIDSTGRSAQHHLHFHSVDLQRGISKTIPVVFHDSSTRQVRAFFIFSPVKGNGDIDGKPVSFGYYVSENDEAPVRVNPVIIRFPDPASATTPPALLHSLVLDIRRLGVAIPESVTLFTTPDPADNHFHSITLTAAQIDKIMRLQDIGDIALDPAKGHTHNLVSHGRRGSLSSIFDDISVVSPFRGHLLAERPEPYTCVGGQLVVRVNDRATEYYFFGSHRPRLIGEIGLDGGFTDTDKIDIADSGASTVVSPQPTPNRADVTEYCARLNAAMRTSAPGGIDTIARAIPVLVIETRRYGSGASLSASGSAFSSLAAPGRPSAVTGSGVFGNLNQVDCNDLETHVRSILTGGWSPPPAGLSVSSALDQVSIDAGGASVVFSGGGGRSNEVLSGLYDAAAMKLRATGPLPLGSGDRIGVNGWSLPVAALPARAVIDTTHAAFAADALVPERPLSITVNMLQRDIVLASGGAAPAKLVRRICNDIEGVRAWASGASVVVETIAAGDNASLSISKQDKNAAATFNASGSGAGFELSDTGGASLGIVNLSCAMRAHEFTGVVLDAIARGGVGAPAAAGLKVDLSGNKLSISVDAGHTLAVRRSHFTGGGDPLQLATSSDGLKIESALLGATVDLPGPGFVDIAVDAAVIRIPFDGSPARLELGPLDGRFVASGDTLNLTVNGTALPPISVGSAASHRELADLIAAASTDITVRIAYTVAIERALYGNSTLLELRDSSGLALSGFLKDRALYSSKAAGRLDDHVGFASDKLGNPDRDNGKLLRVVTSTITDVSGKKKWTLEAPSGFDMKVDVSPTADPLGFANPGGDLRRMVSAELNLPLSVDFKAINYVFSIFHEGRATVAATGRMQLSSGPAIARATADRTALFIPDPSVLSITVIEPTSPNDERERTFSIDLKNSRTIDDVAQRITSEAPLVNAWVVQKGTDRLLHLETVGTGAGWKLRFGPTKLLYALGFEQRHFDWSADRMEVAGGGTVRNGAGVTQAEITALINDMIATVTGISDNPDATVDPTTLFARLDGNDIVCSSLAGSVSIETRPPEMLSKLNASATDGDLRLTGLVFALDTGDILVRAGTKLLGVVHCDAERAGIRASLPLPTEAAAVANMTNLLKAPHSIVFSSGSATVNLSLPDAITTLDDAIEFYAANAPACSFTKDASGHLVISSRVRGSSSSVGISFASWTDLTSYPADTILGFTHADVGGGTSAASWKVEAAGRGLFGSIESVNANDLLMQIRSSADHGAGIQGYYDVEVSGVGASQSVVLRGRGSNVRLRQQTTPPDGISFKDSTGVAGNWDQAITAPYPGTLDLTGEIVNLEVEVDGTGRNAHVLLWGHPARFPLTLPTHPADLDGKALVIETGKKDSSNSIAWDPAMNVTFSTASSTGFDEAAAQIERACQWKVRCSLTATALIIETVAEGWASALRVSAPAGSTSAITGDPASGFTVSGSPEAYGAGSVPLVDEVKAADYRDLLKLAFIEDAANSDAAEIGGRSFDWSAYYCDDSVRTHAFMKSKRNGCISSVAPLVDSTKSFGWKKEFQRAPAIFASVALPPISGTINISGALSILFNQNEGGEDLPNAQVVDIHFPAKPGGYSAADIASRLNEELLSRGAGQAGAYPDGTVVIESAVPGINGYVCVPAPSTGGGSNAALISALLGAGPNPLRGRGWPGIPAAELGDLTPGFRSKPGNAAVDAIWRFSDGTRNVTVNVAKNDTLAQVRDKCENVFQPTTSAGRMASCQINEEDQCLYIEAAGATLNLVVEAAGRTLDVIDPSLPGQTPEREEEPACGLRRTNETRTWYFCRDRFDRGKYADMDESKWVRATAVMRALTGSPSDPAGQPGGNLQIPGGRYWMAVRPDAAKTTNYNADADMIISATSLPINPSDPSAGNYVIVHRARYWVRHANGEPISLARTTDGAYLVDLVIG